MRFVLRLPAANTIAACAASAAVSSTTNTSAFRTTAPRLAPFRPRGSPTSSSYNADGDAPSSSPRGAGGFAGGPGSSLAPKPHLQESPTKDRMPPAHYNPRDPRRRLAILIDGSRVDAYTYTTAIEPAILAYGVPVVVRVFDTDLRDGWVDIVEPSLGVIGGRGGMIDNSRSDSPNRNLELAQNAKDAGGANGGIPRPAAAANNGRIPSIEWFRMDRFIPVPVQIAADAQHMYDFRAQNKIEGVVMVCTEAERVARFEKYFPRLQGKGFSQISFDEKGAGLVVIEDNREGDGSSGLSV